MGKVFYMTILVGVVLFGCNHQSEPDFTVDDCKESGNYTTILDDLGITGVMAEGGESVDPPEEGESFVGLTCIAFNTIADDEVEIGVINFWLRCEHYDGVIESLGRNQFQITLVDPNPAANSLCDCPFDFTFTLDIEHTFQALTVEVLFGGDDWENSYHGYEAVFSISQQDSGMQCWEAEWAQY